MEHAMRTFVYTIKFNDGLIEVTGNFEEASHIREGLHVENYSGEWFWTLVDSEGNKHAQIEKHGVTIE